MKTFKQVQAEIVASKLSALDEKAIAVLTEFFRPGAVNEPPSDDWEGFAE